MPLTQQRRKDIARLRRRKDRERLGQALVEGVRSVEAAVEAGARLVEVLVTPEARADLRVAALLERVSVPIYEVTSTDLAALSDVEHAQGVLAVAHAPLFDSVGAAQRVLALDAVQDPGNVGVLVRTAAWFGVEAVLVGGGTVDPYNPKAVRAAMGGLWDVRLVTAPDLAATLAALKRDGFTHYGAAMEGTDAQVWQPRAPSVLVLGSEAHGLSPAVAAQLDEAVTISGNPARQGVESLNVAVAAGILISRWSSGR